MQVHQALQDLPRPALQHHKINVAMLAPVPVRCGELGGAEVRKGWPAHGGTCHRVVVKARCVTIHVAAACCPQPQPQTVPYAHHRYSNST